jgi:hypothetical protein
MDEVRALKACTGLLQPRRPHIALSAEGCTGMVVHFVS